MEEKIKLRDFYITNDFCLIIGKVGVIADTHLGFDICINERGGNFPQIQKDSIAERINNIIDKYKLKTLVIIVALEKVPVFRRMIGLIFGAGGTGWF